MRTTLPTSKIDHIREILVGRQVEKLEQRLDFLENKIKADSAREHPVKAVTQYQQQEQIAQLRDDLDSTKLRQFEEIRRLAIQVQSVARYNKELAQEAKSSLWKELGEGFDHWQNNFLSYLNQRERALEQRLESRIGKQTHEGTEPNRELVAALEQFGQAALHLSNTLQQSQNL